MPDRIIIRRGVALEQAPPYTCDLLLEDDDDTAERCGEPAAYLARSATGEPSFFICEGDNHWTVWPLDRQEDLVAGVTPAGMEPEVARG